MILFTPFKSMLINVFFFPSSFSSFCVCVCVLKSMFLQVGKVFFKIMVITALRHVSNILKVHLLLLGGRNTHFIHSNCILLTLFHLKKKKLFTEVLYGEGNRIVNQRGYALFL